MTFDRSVFGHRLRHRRRERGLTLDELGTRVDRPSPYLSLLENGKREPKLSLVDRLADALETTAADLLSPEPPHRRAALELALDRIREDPRYQALQLPELKPTARLPDEALEHVVTLFGLATRRPSSDSVDSVRDAAASVSAWLREQDGYLAHVEHTAAEVLDALGHDDGALTSRDLTSIVSMMGYRVVTVEDIPTHVRSIVDEDAGVIYVAQRNALRTRQARKAVLQTLAGKVLGHSIAATVFDHHRQRLEEAYFAAAVLIPERSAAPALAEAKRQRDLSVEDIKERFYVSYEMAAQRFTNLATRHLGIATHFVHSDRDGVVWKAYSNDGFPLPTSAGASEGQRLCRHLGSRTAYGSPDRFDVHYQFTDTPAGSYWSATHLTPDATARALTTGVRYADARWFRGRRTAHQEVSGCPDDTCCRVPAGRLPRIRAGHRIQEHLVTVLSGDTPPPLELAELAEFLHKHPGEDGSSEADEDAYADPWARGQEGV